MLDPITNALAERGLENFRVASGIWARASGGETWSCPGLDCFTSTVQRRAFNQLIIATGSPPRESDLRDALSRFAEAGLRLRVRMRDVNDDALRPDLEALGLVHQGGLPAMVFDKRLRDAPPPPLEIVAVRDIPQLSDHVRVVAEAFEWEAAELGQVFRPAILDEPKWHGWVGYQNGLPVAASQLVTDGGTGGIYYVAVSASHRRKGFGEAITFAAVEAAQSAGCDLATLNASPHGYPVYRRMGFRDAGTHVGYVPEGEDD